MKFRKQGWWLLIVLICSSCKPITYVQFFDISKFAIPIVALIAYFSIRTKYNRFVKSDVQKAFFTFSRFKVLFVAIGLFIVSAGITFLLPNFHPSTQKELIQYGERTDKEELVLEGLRLNLFEHPNDNIAFYTYYSRVYKYEVGLSQNEQNSATIINAIREYKAAEGGYFELACLNTLIHEYDKAAFYTITLDEKEPVVCFLKAQVALYKGDSIGFVSHLITEMENEGLKAEVYPILASYFSSSQQNDFLYDLVKSDTFLNYLDFSLAGRVYYTHGDVYRYVFSTVMHVINHVSVFSVFGAFAILLAYVLFLRQLDLFNKESWFWVVLMIGYGVVSPFFVFPFSNFLEYSMSFNANDSLVGNFIFYVFRVGLIEEYVKLFPFIFFLFFTKKLKEPYDYMFYTALSAFGFAFTENLIYFSNHGTTIIQTRGFFSVLGHAVFTSSVGYLLAYSRFKKKLLPAPILLIIGLFLAAILHGLFDFLLKENVFALLLFLVYFLTLVHVWSVMLNNCMNNSSYFDHKKLPQLKQFHLWATVALLLIVCSQFFLTLFYVGKEYAIELFMGAFYPGIYMVLFLSNTLGRFDFFKGYWEGLLPNTREVLFPRTANTNEYVGLCVAIELSPKAPIGEIGTLMGRIVERKIVNHSPFWYLVELSPPLKLEEIVLNKVLVEIEDDTNSLVDGVKVDSQICLLPIELDYSKIKIKEKLWYGGECSLFKTEL